MNMSLTLALRWYNYDNDLQVTLLIHVLTQKNLCCTTFEKDVDALITTARHIESALKMQGTFSLASCPVDLTANSTVLHDIDSSKLADMKEFQAVLEIFREV